MTTNSSSGVSWMKYSTQGPKQLKNSVIGSNSTSFNVYVNTRIASGKRKNYDNFYINGVFNNINVANASYHASGSNKKAIFAICCGFDETDKCFEATRMIFDMLDKERDTILNARTLFGIKKNLVSFVSTYNEKMVKEHLGALNIIIVVFAFSSAVYVSCGECALVKYSSNGKGKIIASKNLPLGINNELYAKAKRIPYFLKNDMCMFSTIGEAEEFLKSTASVKKKNDSVRDYVTRYMDFTKNSNVTTTAIALSADEKPSVTSITGGIMLGSGMTLLISIIHAIIQLKTNSMNF